MSAATVRPWRNLSGDRGEHRTRQAVAVRRAAGSVRRSTVCRLSAIPANVAGFRPPSVRPLAACLAIAATVRASPATFGRNSDENGLASRPPRRPCPRPSETRRALCKPSATVCNAISASRGGFVGNIERGERAAPVSGQGFRQAVAVQPFDRSGLSAIPATRRPFDRAGSVPRLSAVRPCRRHHRKRARIPATVRPLAGSVRQFRQGFRQAVRQSPPSNAATVGRF